MKTSVFKDIKTYSGDDDLTNVLSEIRYGKLSHKISYLRGLLNSGSTEEFDIEKRRLPAFTPTATFNQRRKIDFINHYTGCIVLDIDDLPAGLLEIVKNKAKECLYTYTCFVSPSGHGLKVLVCSSSQAENHEIMFIAIKDYYEEYLNVFIDESGKDLTRLCFFSHDPELYINENSELFKA